jgi:hypothetical protein
MADGLMLSIDPGVRGCGVALFRGTELEQGVYVEGHSHAQRAESWLAMVGSIKDFIGARVVDQLVVELPQVYVTARAKGDPNDLIQLAAVVGGLCVAFEKARSKVYLPAEWKGQVPKEIVHARALQRLSTDERSRISCRKKALLHNAMDAVSIGLKYLGRL